MNIFLQSRSTYFEDVIEENLFGAYPNGQGRKEYNEIEGCTQNSKFLLGVTETLVANGLSVCDFMQAWHARERGEA